MRTMTFRAGAALLAVTAVAAMMTGCSASSGGNSAEKPVTLKLVATTDADQPLIQKVIDAFHKANPKITVNATYTPPTAFTQNVPRSMATPNGPDLVMTFPGVGGGPAAYALQDAGLIVNQNKAPWVKDLTGSQRAALGHDGFIAFKPVGVDVMGVVYNSTYMKEEGLKPAQTWTQMLGLCKTLRSKGIQPMSFGLQDSFTTFFISFALAASTVYTPDPTFDSQQLAGKATFSGNKGWATAFNKFLEMKNAGCFADGYQGTTYAEMGTQLAARKVMMTVTVAPQIASIRQADPKDTFIDVPLPAYDNPSKNGVAVSLSVGMAINAKGKHIPAAQKFVDFANSDANSAIFAKAYGVVPLGSAPAPAGLEAMIAAIKKGRVGSYSNQLWINPDTDTVYTADAQQVLEGTMSVDAFLKAVDQTVKTR